MHICVCYMCGMHGIKGNGIKGNLIAAEGKKKNVGKKTKKGKLLFFPFNFPFYLIIFPHKMSN